MAQEGKRRVLRQGFDFGDRAFVGQLRADGTAIANDRAAWHLPPADMLFVQRKISGTALLAAVGGDPGIEAIPYLGGASAVGASPKRIPAKNGARGVATLMLAQAPTSAGVRCALALPDACASRRARDCPIPAIARHARSG